MQASVLECSGRWHALTPTWRQRCTSRPAVSGSFDFSLVAPVGMRPAGTRPCGLGVWPFSWGLAVWVLSEAQLETARRHPQPPNTSWNTKPVNQLL